MSLRVAPRRWRVPAPLLGVVLLALLQACAWAVVLPAFEGPDEVSHFAYVQRTVERGSISWTALGAIPHDRARAYSTEVIAARKWSGLGPLQLNPAMRAAGTPVDERRWHREARGLGDADRSDGEFTSAMANPPLYYLYESAFYAPLEHADVFTRAFVMRLATVPLFLVAVIAAWLLAGEVFGRRRWPQAVAASVVALQPMLAQLGGTLNPDALIAAEWALALWLAAVIVNRGLTASRLAGAAALTVAAGLTHGRALPVVLPLVLAVALRLWPRVAARGPGARVAALSGAVAAVLLGLAGSLHYALRGDVDMPGVREFGSYVWQFYLPKLPSMSPSPGPRWGVRDVFVDRLWSGFAQLDVSLAPGVLDAVAVGTVVFLAAVVVSVLWALSRRRPHPGPRPLAWLLGLSALGLLWSLHVAAWRDLPVFGDPIITGRYLTPLLPVAGLGLASVALVLPRRAGAAAVVVVLGAELLLALASLGATVVRFYA